MWGGSISEKELEEHIKKLQEPETKEKAKAQKKINECIEKAAAKAGDEVEEDTATMGEALREIDKEIRSALDIPPPPPPPSQDGERTAVFPAIAVGIAIRHQ